MCPEHWQFLRPLRQACEKLDIASAPTRDDPKRTAGTTAGLHVPCLGGSFHIVGFLLHKKEFSIDRNSQVGLHRRLERCEQVEGLPVDSEGFEARHLRQVGSMLNPAGGKGLGFPWGSKYLKIGHIYIL